MAYCTHSDLYAHGLPRGSFPNPGRLARSVLASTDRVSLDEHGFEVGDVVRFRAEADGSLPAELTEGAAYYVVSVYSPAEFSVSASSGGASINFSSDGSRVLVIAEAPIDAAIEWASRLVDDMLPAHAVPIPEPVPPIVRMTTAELAAHKLGARAGAVPQSLTQIADAARKRLERWNTGVPIRDANASAPTNLATSATIPARDVRGYRRCGL